MTRALAKILNSIGITLGVMDFALFLAAEIHAWWVISPTGILCENPDFGVMWHQDSMVPMQFRLMSYRAGAGDFRDWGFLLPAAALIALGSILLIGMGANYLEEALEKRKRLPQDPGKAGELNP